MWCTFGISIGTHFWPANIPEANWSTHVSDGTAFSIIDMDTPTQARHNLNIVIQPRDYVYLLYIT